jgi:hypothetical protein
MPVSGSAAIGSPRAINLWMSGRVARGEELPLIALPEARSMAPFVHDMRRPRARENMNELCRSMTACPLGGDVEHRQEME